MSIKVRNETKSNCPNKEIRKSNKLKEQEEGRGVRMDEEQIVIMRDKVNEKEN